MPFDWPGPGSSAASFVRPSANAFESAPQRWDHRFVGEQLDGRRHLRGQLGGDHYLRRLGRLCALGGSNHLGAAALAGPLAVQAR